MDMANFNDLFNSDVKFPIECTLPFVKYTSDGSTIVEDTKVKVVFAAKGRLDVIICEFDSGYQDYYFNGGFKMLSEANMTMKEWWQEEEVGIKCPKEFSKVIVCMPNI